VKGYLPKVEKSEKRKDEDGYVMLVVMTMGASVSSDITAL